MEDEIVRILEARFGITVEFKTVGELVILIMVHGIERVGFQRGDSFNPSFSGRTAQQALQKMVKFISGGAEAHVFTGRWNWNEGRGRPEIEKWGVGIPPFCSPRELEMKLALGGVPT